MVVPVTFADKTLDKKKEGYEALNELDGAVQAECKCDDSVILRLVLSSPPTSLLGTGGGSWLLSFPCSSSQP